MKFSTKNKSYFLIQFAAVILFLNVATGSAEKAGNGETETFTPIVAFIKNILAVYKLDVPTNEKILRIAKMSHGNFETADAPRSASRSSAMNNVFNVNGINEDEIVCPVEGTHRFPHPDCTKFIYCVEGEPSILDCPDGLYYHTEKHECDFPFNVPECVGGTRPTEAPPTTTTTTTTTTTEPPTTTAELTTTTEEPTTTTEYLSTTPPTTTAEPTTTTEVPTTSTPEPPTTTAEPTTTTEPLTTTTTPTTTTTTRTTTTTERGTTGHPLPDCPPYQIGDPPTFFPGPWCDNYYMCTEDGPVLMQCPRPLWWDQNIKTCTMPWSSTCNM